MNIELINSIAQYGTAFLTFLFFLLVLLHLCLIANCRKYANWISKFVDEEPAIIAPIVVTIFGAVFFNGIAACGGALDLLIAVLVIGTLIVSTVSIIMLSKYIGKRLDKD